MPCTYRNAYIIIINTLIVAHDSESWTRKKHMDYLAKQKLSVFEKSTDMRVEARKNNASRN